jgi:DNA-binding GntR family transcriptional regulator
VTVLERLDLESARNYAYRVLRHNIIELKLEPGSTVSEQSLCQLLAISRTPVREALLDLNRQHLVDVVPQRGTMVSLIDPRLVEEGQQLRTLVEREVVKAACRTMDDKAFRHLESNVIMQEYHAAHADYDEFIRLDNEFHRMLFKIVGKEATYQVVHDFQSHFDRERKLSLMHASIPALVQDHRAVLESIRKGDAEEAARLVELHLAHVLVDQQLLMEKFPDYFVR